MPTLLSQILRLSHHERELSGLRQFVVRRLAVSLQFSSNYMATESAIRGKIKFAAMIEKKELDETV